MATLRKEQRYRCGLQRYSTPNDTLTTILLSVVLRLYHVADSTLEVRA